MEFDNKSILHILLLNSKLRSDNIEFVSIVSISFIIINRIIKSDS